MIEDALMNINSSSKFNQLECVTLCKNNSRNYGRTTIARLLPLPQLFKMYKIDVLLHKSLLDAFFRMVSMALSRYLDRRRCNIVAPIQAAHAIATSLPRAVVSLMHWKNASGSTFVFDEAVSYIVL